MVWSISYSTSGSTISFNVCADTGGGYFYILEPDGVVLPSTVGGINAPGGICTPFSVTSSQLTKLGTYSMVLAGPPPTELTMAQVWFYVTPSPFTVTPPSGNSGGGTQYDCVGGVCQPVSGGRYTDPSCQGACSAPPPPPTQCTVDEVNIMGTCVNKNYIKYGAIGFGALFLLSILKK